MNTAITPCRTYSKDEVKKALGILIENTSFPDVSGKKVLVKPNILSDLPPETAVTTHPAVLEALLEAVKERGAREILCGDSSGMQVKALSAKASGLEAVIKRTGAVFTDLRSSYTELTANGYTIPISNHVLEADLVISAAKFKTHQLMLSTGAVKNLYGCVPGMMKAEMHMKAFNNEAFAQVLIGIYELVKPQWSLIDAVTGMEGPGPRNGRPREIGYLMASENGYALDRAEAVMMGYHEVPLLKAAEQKHPGITSSDYPLLNPYDLVMKDFSRIPEKKTSMLRVGIDNLFGLDSRPYPVFHKDRCKLCQRCVQVCPGKALRKEDGRIKLTKKKCIHCYCCHEMCPFDAITVK